MSPPPTQQSSVADEASQAMLLLAPSCSGLPAQYFVVGQSAMVSQ
jgi:hypothetical protein